MIFIELLIQAAMLVSGNLLNDFFGDFSAAPYSL
jgi:hypothetical protein